MRLVSYIFFYITLLMYELVSMNEVVAWQSQTDSKGASVPLLGLIILSGFSYILSSKKTARLSFFGISFVLFYGYLLCIALVHGYIDGFRRTASMLIYILPMICFWVEYRAQYDSEICIIRKRLLALFFTTLLIAFFLYYKDISSYATYIGKSFVGTNTSYYLLYFTPILCLVTKRNRIKFVLILTAIVVIASSKRGETISIFMGIVVYYYLLSRNTMKGEKGTGRYINYLVISLFFLGILYCINMIFGGVVSDRLIESVDDEGSGRKDIYDTVWMLILSSGYLEQWFGHGYDAVKEMTNLSAHNDVLEMIYDFGWICLFFFLLFIIKGFHFSFKHPIKEVRAVLGMSLTFYLFCMMVSVIITRADFLNLLALCWGAASGIPESQSRLAVLKKKN